MINLQKSGTLDDLLKSLFINKKGRCVRMSTSLEVLRYLNTKCLIMSIISSQSYLKIINYLNKTYLIKLVIKSIFKN